MRKTGLIRALSFREPVSTVSWLRVVVLFFFSCPTFFLSAFTNSSFAEDLRPIYVADADAFNGGAVFRVDPATGAQTVISSGGSFHQPCGIAVEASGSILVGDRGGSGIIGKVIRIDPVTGQQTVLSSGGSPCGIAIEPSGDFLVVDSLQNAIIRFDSITATQTVVSSGGFLADPTDLAFDSEGNIIVAVFGSNLGIPGIFKINPLTGSQSIVSTGDKFVRPWRLTVAADGNIFVTDENTKNILKVDPISGVQTIITTLGRPSGITTDSSGNLIVAQEIANSLLPGIFRIDPATGSTSTISSFGLFFNPDGVAIAQDSTLPSLIIIPPAIDFLAVSVGSSKDLTFTIKNGGGGTLTGNVSTSQPFSIVGDNSFSLAANQTTDITVRFSPTAAITYNGSVSLSSNAGNGSVTLTGTGVPMVVAPTTTWTTPPPSSITAGQNFTVAWTTTGNPTHVNIHWNPTDPLAAGCCLGPSDTTNSSTVSPTTSPATLTAPTKNADGTPITIPTIAKYVVHASNSAGSGSSTVASLTVNPAAPNRAPLLSALGQFKSDGMTEIPEGGTTGESTVILKATLSDPDSDQVRLEIELRQIGEPFTGTPTLISTFVPSGAIVSVARVGLASANYHWRVRAMDNKGAFTAWKDFGLSGNTDFTIKQGTPGQQMFSLTVVKKGGGAGLITSSPEGINCGTQCTANFPSRQRIKLTVASNPGSVFVGWNVPGCNSNQSCILNLDGNQTVEATFALQPNPDAAKIIYIGVCGAAKIGDECRKDSGWYDPRDEEDFRSFNPLLDSDLEGLALYSSGFDSIGLRVGTLLPNSVTLIASFSMLTSLADLGSFAGFNRQTSSIIVDIVKQFYRSDDKVYLVGHSLGGGIVVDAARILKEENIPVELAGIADGIMIDKKISSNVARAMNYYNPNGVCPLKLLVATDITQDSQSLTEVSNTPVVDPPPQGPSDDSEPCGGHKNMDNDPRVWKPFMNYILRSFAN